MRRATTLATRLEGNRGTTMNRYTLAARRTALVLALGAACGAQAAEAYTNWDNFEGATQIDEQRWLFMERHRMIEQGALRMIQRDLGSQTGNSGVNSSTWATNLANPGAVTQIKGVITVNGYELGDCAASPDSSRVQARLGGEFFNAGPVSPTPGDRTNDVGAVIRLVRESRSADGANVMRVEGLVYQCTTADCNYSQIDLGTVPLGTATVGQAVTLRMEWDKTNNRFNFFRDTDPVKRVTYAVADSLPPVLLYRHLGTRTTTATCMAGRKEAFIDAKFDNVFLNDSAVP